MARGTCRVVFVCALLLLGGGGCGGAPPEPMCSCSPQTSRVLVFQPLNGTGTIDWGGSVPVVDGGAASDGTCVAVLGLSPVDSCGLSAPDFSIKVDCEKPNVPNAGFVVDPGDVPGMSPGYQTVAVTDVYPATTTEPTITLQVESKIGTVEGYWEAPTPDFDEKLVLDFQSNTLTASLQFEIKASQLEQATRTCEMCAC